MATNCDLAEDLFAEFSALLADKMGLYYPKDRWNDLEKKLRPLAFSLGFAETTECIKLLSELLKQGESISDLAYHLTIGETYFFRDSRVFDVLEHQILPEIIKRKSNEKILRIWSAGCCTGEEPYSIAMLLHRLLNNIQEWEIHLIASDINNEFLHKARQGQYGKWSLRATPAEFRDSYFVPDKNGYHLSPEIRSMVRFTHANLVNPGHFENSITYHEMDLILCNNVLIYFSRDQVDRTIQRLAGALAKDGWLGVSAIEAPFVSHTDLSPHNFEGALFFKKDFKHSLDAHMPLPAIIAAEREKPPHDPHILLTTILPEFLTITEPEIAFSSPPQELRNTQSPQIPPSANPIDRIRSLADSGHLAEALNESERALAGDKLNPIIHYLKAEILAGIGDTQAATKSLKNAIFLEPDFVTAHYMLGLLDYTHNKHDSATREFRIALQLMERYQPEDILPGTLELTAARAKDHLLVIYRRNE